MSDLTLQGHFWPKFNHGFQDNCDTPKIRPKKSDIASPLPLLEFARPAPAPGLLVETRVGKFADGDDLVVIGLQASLNAPRWPSAGRGGGG